VLDEAMGRLSRLRVVSRLRVGANRRFEADIAMMHAMVDDVIRARRAQPADTRDLLGLMMAAFDPLTREQLDDANIRYQVITFLIAGHETTSGLLSFALHLMLAHPAVLEQARAEVDRVLAGGRALAYDDLNALDVIDRILKETLRLWPTAPGFSVAPYEDTLLGGRYPIARDRRVNVLLTALHRDPAVWADPDRFDIDRFLPDNEAKLPAHAYKPFGNGSRSCIGRQFAIMEAKIALAMLLARFDLTDPYGYQLAVRETLSLKPEGFRLRVRRRT
jgi:cytochrome P450/NADPH-cytochrome P450 reductase